MEFASWHAHYIKRERATTLSRNTLYATAAQRLLPKRCELRNKFPIIAILIIAAISYGYYYYFVQTLRLSDIVGPLNNPIASFVVNLVDFDTGLTRYDLHRLSQKAPYWNQRIQQIQAMPPSIEKEKAQQELTNEMMADPSMSKIVRKLASFGFGALETFVKSIL